ncbi:hypothetical protein MLD38_011752 [Melastoma candidum]|uniref:Uncharacterized protein n=1 Tax=Melastoma candidum TaxID=119954 RepID=A0ACB9R5T3_9MYRT|nr:hypothetical protein MLD38_011752 [Melastoma candidum]
MIVPMDNMSAPSRERAQRLHEKNIELDSRRRRSAQARVPSDPSIWQQMRENYEAIILEDHAFSEQHNTEHALWQLHYKRIEELRAHYSSAQASNADGKGASRPDRITKIRLQFKTFLSEATGFYHDLIMKIRSKYGLPLVYFSDDSESRIVMEKDSKRFVEMKKGLISCHRCLIYLGDLARYKGLYGEVENKNREFAAASSYYLQAASLWPSIGNPHHQLAILASYSGDDFGTIYRYFRSLAVDSPCSTARDNLIVAFEMNRQNFCQLPVDSEASASRDTGRRRRREAKLLPKENNPETAPLQAPNAEERCKAFCIRFVRLNGILFTRTSLETFPEVLSVVSTGFSELLSAGPEDVLNFGIDARENGLFFVKLVSILIFTAKNVNRETEGQTYADIVQRAVLLQHAYTAVFEIMGLTLERCELLRDVSSSYLLPGVLVFVEWLACCPDVAMGSDPDERQASCRSNFWSRLISVMNKILATGEISTDDDEEDTCFKDMSKYEEGETENRLALWEDFELRGFSPLVPAQTILDFSKKQPFSCNNKKEINSRIRRIFAAVRALVSGVKIDQQSIFYDSRTKRFIVGADNQQLEDEVIPLDSVVPKEDGLSPGSDVQKSYKLDASKPSSQFLIEGDEDEEEIVFRPTVSEKQTDVPVSTSNYSLYDGLELSKATSVISHPFPAGLISRPLDSLKSQQASDAPFQSAPPPVVSSLPQFFQPMAPQSSIWLGDDGSVLANNLNNLSMQQNGHFMKPEVQNISHFHPPASLPVPSAARGFYNQIRSQDLGMLPSRIGTVATTGLVADVLAALPPGLKKNPVSRPVRHRGPPPGFSSVPKQVNEPIMGSTMAVENPIMDDYSWLDGYQVPPPIKSPVLNSFTGSSSAVSQTLGSHTGVTASASGQSHGLQFPSSHFPAEKQNGWKDINIFDALKNFEPQLPPLSLALNQSHDFAPVSEQYNGSVWNGRHYV